MKHSVMLLAAGRGKRLQPLTDQLAKPLLFVQGASLIEHHLRRLAQHGYHQVLINISYRGEQIKQYLGDGQQYGITIVYSDEGSRALETAGGIKHALPLLSSETLLVINSDLYTNWLPRDLTIGPNDMAHIVLVDNPEDHPQGDFCLHNGRVTPTQGTRLSFSGIAYYRRDLFTNLSQDRYKLADVLQPAVAKGQVSGEHYQGLWINVGTLDQLARVQAR